MSALYTVFAGNEVSSFALTACECARHIYTQNGQGYRLEPKLAEGEQVVASPWYAGRLVFEIWMKDSADGAWYPSMREAEGKTAASAEEGFLLDSFDGEIWAPFWRIVAE